MLLIHFAYFKVCKTSHKSSLNITKKRIIVKYKANYYQITPLFITNFRIFAKFSFFAFKILQDYDIILAGEKMKNFETIILGGGASACICAITLGQKGKRILVIDDHSKPAKKILATGNGRCNLTNINVNSGCYNQNIDEFFRKFNQFDTIKFFSSLGLETYSDDEGRVYPLSNSAKSVVDVISNAFEKFNISFSGEEKVLLVTKQDKQFIVKTDKNEYSCKKLVLALGGNSIQKIENNFKLSPSPCQPSLVAIKTQSTKLLSGVRHSPAKAQLKLGNEVLSQNGEILFKDSGLSGIAIFNLSAYLARKGWKGGEIEIDLLPNLSKEELKKLLTQRKSLNLPIPKFFDGLFVKELGYEILNRVKINENRTCDKLSDNEIDQLCAVIKSMTFAVKGCYDNNQVYSGGVKLGDLTENLESKKVKNLFLCGEVCDVDGLCGGYNLQWAWTSGKIVGDAL